MKQFLIIVCLFVAVVAAAQQQLTFTKADSSKTISIRPNDLVRLSYTGYFKQQQQSEGFVTTLTDSSITLKPRKKLFQKAGPVQTIYLSDITGFRKYSRFRPAGEILYGFVAIGTAGTITAIIAQANLATALSFVIAAGTSMVTGIIGKLVMGNTVKHKLAEGWRMELQAAR